MVRKDNEGITKNEFGNVKEENPLDIKIGDGVNTAGVNNVNELNVTNPDLEIGLGNIPGRSLRAVTGDKLATTTESTISPNLVGRYPFPSIAAQMTIVSDSTDDILGGTGTNAVLVRGLTVNGMEWIDDNELVLMDGTDPVTTTKEFIRVNSIGAVVVGSGGANDGTVTMTNGADTLHSMVAGDNLTRTSIWSTATDLPAYIRDIRVVAGKSVNEATFNIYLTPVTPVGIPTLHVFNLNAFQGQTQLPIIVPFELAGGTDWEITAESDVGTTAVQANFEITQVDIS